MYASGVSRVKTAGNPEPPLPTGGPPPSAGPGRLRRNAPQGMGERIVAGPVAGGMAIPGTVKERDWKIGGLEGTGWGK